MLNSTNFEPFIVPQMHSHCKLQLMLHIVLLWTKGKHHSFFFRGGGIL